MRLKMRLIIAALAVALSAVVAVAAPTAQGAAPSNGSVTVPATGTTTTGLPVTGTFTITSFKRVDGAIRAVGTYTGTVDGSPVTTAASAPVNAINGTGVGGAAPTSAAAAAATGSCQILDLTLGPLHLNLLGLNVDLNQVHLNITAQQGPGNLLDNLLCAVAGLLDNTGGGGLLQAITNLLNHILGQLQL